MSRNFMLSSHTTHTKKQETVQRPDKFQIILSKYAIQESESFDSSSPILMNPTFTKQEMLWCRGPGRQYQQMVKRSSSY
jgi:hypothetical protein